MVETTSMSVILAGGCITILSIIVKKLKIYIHRRVSTGNLDFTIGVGVLNEEFTINDNDFRRTRSI